MSTYLIHHGIKGQRWGVRRFQNEDGSLTSAGQQRYSSARANKLANKADRMREKIDRGGLLKNSRIAKYHNLMERAETAEAVSKESTLSGKAKQYMGDARYARKYSHNANAHREIADNSTGLKKQYNKVSAYNSEQMSKYYGARANIDTKAKVGAEVVTQSIFGVSAEGLGAANVPMKTIAGRDTTVMKEVVIGMLTGGLGNIAMDAFYASTHDYSKDDY